MDNLRIELTDELSTPASCKVFSGVWNPGVITNGPDTYQVLADCPWNVTVTNTSDAYLVTGSVQASLKSECGRCLEEFTVDITGEIEGYYAQDAENAETPEDMGEDEMLTLEDGKYIDLEPLIQAAILIELPLVALCSEDCLGLCPHCGKNLNEGPCSCKEEEDTMSQNPFSVLAGIDFSDS